VSKTPAKPASKKPAAKSAASSKTVKKATAPAKTAAKPAAKPAKSAAPASKPSAKTSKPAAKPAPAPKPSAAKAAHPAPAPKPAPKPAQLPVSKPVAKSPEPAAKAAGHAAAVKAAEAPSAAAVAAVAAPAPELRKPARTAASKYATPAQPPAPLPAPTSRFADRFAPPRPPTRQMNNLELDTPRQAHKSDPKLANAWKSKSGKDLTEAEVLAMPDSEYMNDKQLEFFRVKLQQLKDDLLSNAGETTEHLREDTSIVPDPADRATIEEEHALELRTRDRERKLLKKISQSLARIEAGDYGFCDETGEPIGLGRLIARPTATLSLEAQQRRELKQKMFGD